MTRHPPRSTLFPSTPLSRSVPAGRPHVGANTALLLLSGGLVAALFPLAPLLVDGWKMSPAAAGDIFQPSTSRGARGKSAATRPPDSRSKAVFAPTCGRPAGTDRESGVEGKRVDLGGWRVI